MKYKPEDANSLIPDGEYDGEIAAAEDKLSKKGSEMIEAKVRVWAGGGGPRLVFDYIVNPGSLYKLKQIAAASGQMAKYETGAMGADDIRGISVRVSVKTQKDKTGDFPDKNVIARYLAPAAGEGNHGKPAADDDIPF